LDALKGLIDLKRSATPSLTLLFQIFGDLSRDGAKFLLHGLSLQISKRPSQHQRQHNILAQLGIDPEKSTAISFEPLQTLRKDGVRKAAKILGLLLTHEENSFQSALATDCGRGHRES